MIDKITNNLSLRHQHPTKQVTKTLLIYFNNVYKFSTKLTDYKASYKVTSCLLNKSENPFCCTKNCFCQSLASISAVAIVFQN